MNEELMDGKDSLLEENKKLQQENTILKENAKHNDEIVDKVNWENTQLKLENEQAIKSISHYVYERDVLQEQLKDKDEKISKVIEYCNEHIEYTKLFLNDKDLFEKCRVDGLYIKKILETNKED